MRTPYWGRECDRVMHQPSRYKLFNTSLSRTFRATTLFILCLMICISAQARTPISPLAKDLESAPAKPGFNCAKGHSTNEKMICGDPELARIDYELSLLYAQAKLLTHNSSSFKKTNNEEWLWREQ